MEAPPTEKDTRWVSFSKQNSRNFPFGEYSRTLRLASEPHTEKPWLRVRVIGIRLMYREYGGRHCLRRMRTGSRARAHGARAMKREAPPKQKSIPMGWLFLNKIPGISPSVNIRAPFALQASLQIFGWRMRTGSRARAHGARAMKREAPPTEKASPVGWLFLLAVMVLKDATAKRQIHR